jgi:hypothetical protein
MDSREYVNYTAERFLSDDFFLESELHPTVESRSFWSDLERTDGKLSKEIEAARLILASIPRTSPAEPRLSPANERELWERIRVVNRRQRLWKRVRLVSVSTSVAASLAFLCIWGLRSFEPEPDYQALLQEMPEAGASEKIQLVLSGDQHLAFDSQDAKIDYLNEGEIRVNSEKIAVDTKKSKQPVFNQLIVPMGKRSSLTFADGTRIWVNAASKVIYPAQFAANKREIFVEGEVYLNVSAQEGIPFIVKTRQMDITVLGTQFSVSAYENESQSNVVLVSGKVEVKTGGNDKSLLSPNQRFTYNTNTHRTRIDYVEVADYIAWKEGYYPFRKQTLDVVLNKLIKYYGVGIEWEPAVCSLTCSGKLDLKEELTDVLNALAKAAPIVIEERESHIYVKVNP